MPTRRRNRRLGGAGGQGQFSGNLVEEVHDNHLKLVYYLKTYRDWRAFSTERAALRLLAHSELPVPKILGEFPDPARPKLQLSRLPGQRPVVRPAVFARKSSSLRCCSPGRLSLSRTLTSGVSQPTCTTSSIMTSRAPLHPCAAAFSIFRACSQTSVALTAELRRAAPLAG